MRIRTITKLLFTICSCVFCFEPGNLNAQTAITTVNGSHTIKDIMLDWTIGEPLTASLLDADVDITQGFHQPAIICNNCDEEIKHIEEFIVQSMVKNESSQIEIYPNPADQITNLKLDLGFEKHAFVELYDSSGQRIVFRKLNNTEDSKVKTQLELDHLISGQYYVRIFNASFSEVKQFQIVH